jgi:hypothetical protein
MRHSGRFGFVIMCIVAAVLLRPSPVRSQDGDAWTPLEFLVGTWAGAGSGQPGEAIAGTTTFSFDLDRNVMVRRNRAEYAPKPGDTTRAVHEDLMIIYRSPGGPKYHAMYFDNEKHIISYGVFCPAGGSCAVFESEATDKAPRFRMVYDLGADGVLATEFFIAPPGGEFKSYVKGTLRRSVQKEVGR